MFGVQVGALCCSDLQNVHHATLVYESPQIRVIHQALDALVVSLGHDSAETHKYLLQLV